MIAVVQRVLRGSVTVEQEIVGQIDMGLVVLAAVEAGDGDAEVEWMAAKVAGLRIFRSEDGIKHFDRDVSQVGGKILLVSNFTVAAETGSGKRPEPERCSASGPGPGDIR